MRNSPVCSNIKMYINHNHRTILVDSGTCGDNLTWNLNDASLLSIMGTGEMEDC